MPTPRECFQELDEKLKTERKRTAGLDATFQYILSGPEGGEFWIKAASGTGETGEGRAENPNTTVYADDQTFVDIATGKLEGSDAFFTGKIKMEGDAPLGIYLKQIFGG